MTLEEMQKQIEDARKIVRTWPEWKQNILVQSGSPTVSEPRKPVDNTGNQTTKGNQMTAINHDDYWDHGYCEMLAGEKLNAELQPVQNETGVDPASNQTTQGYQMILVHELISDLRRFPPNATVTLHDRQILVDATPYERNGNTVFDAQCPDSELPELLRNSVELAKRLGDF